VHTLHLCSERRQRVSHNIVMCCAGHALRAALKLQLVLALIRCSPCGCPLQVLVLGDEADKKWARRHLQRGTPVFCRQALLTAVMQQKLPTDAPLFTA
jgi:hypothetical protein